MSGENTNPSSLGPVTISARDIYDKIVTLEGEISRLSSDLKLISEIHSITMKKINDHEERVRLLERRVWALPSAATVIAGAALVVPFIT